MRGLHCGQSGDAFISMEWFCVGWELLGQQKLKCLTEDLILRLLADWRLDMVRVALQLFSTILYLY